MLFFTSVLYSVLMFGLMGQIPIRLLAGKIGLLPEWIVMAVFNIGIYLCILVLVRKSSFVWQEIALPRGGTTERRLRNYLDVGGCRWLNTAGLLSVGAGAAVLFMNGLLPYPYWFLFAAVVVGFTDLLWGSQRPLLTSGLPNLRFREDQVKLPQTGKKITFVWQLWSDENKSMDMKKTFYLSHQDYRDAACEPRDHSDPVRYALERHTDSIYQIAIHFREESLRYELTPTQELENVVCFVRTIPYASDDATHNTAEYWNYPIETLYEAAPQDDTEPRDDEVFGSDCEDHAILAAAALWLLGHEVGLFYLAGRDEGHLALGYHDKDTLGVFSASVDGKEYFYVETVPTDISERVGDINQQFLRGLCDVKVFPVKAKR